MYTSEVYILNQLEAGLFVHISSKHAFFDLFREMCTTKHPFNEVFLYTRDVHKKHAGIGTRGPCGFTRLPGCFFPYN